MDVLRHVRRLLDFHYFSIDLPCFPVLRQIFVSRTLVCIAFVHQFLVVLDLQDPGFKFQHIQRPPVCSAPCRTVSRRAGGLLADLHTEGPGFLRKKVLQGSKEI